MKLLSSLLASLALSASLVGCAAPKTVNAPVVDRGQPDIMQIAPAQPIRIDRAALKAKLAARRAITIERFLAYREARVYPMSRDLGAGFHHVWLDENGNLCAAATLISKDWGRDATINAGMADNGIQLAGVKSGELLDWILTSGLAHHEVVAIQVPGFEQPMPEENPQQRQAEIQRLYDIYVDVERQLRGMADRNLELAVDALMERPELARAVIAGRAAGPGQFAQAPRFAQPPDAPSTPVAPPPEPMPEPMPEPRG